MTERINLHTGRARNAGIFIHSELWDAYLEFIGGQAALVYCYLRHLTEEGQSPSCDDIAAVLRMDLKDLQQALAVLVEYDLVSLGTGNAMAVNQPRDKAGLAMLLENKTAEADAIKPLLPDVRGTQRVALATTLRRNQEHKSVYGIVEQEFGRPLSTPEVELLQKLEQKHSREMIVEAVRRAVLNRAFNVTYIDRILFNWHTKGIKCLTDVEKDDQLFLRKKARRLTKKVAGLGESTSEQNAEESSSEFSSIYKRMKELRSKEE